jgi:exopolyphosphatase / guanosine-5'-triphosphate,3'-diphosphate pyrophosphatase
LIVRVHPFATSAAASLVAEHVAMSANARPVRPRVLNEGALYVAIDLGSNNCRMSIAQPTKRAFHVLHSYSRIVRLAEGLSQSTELTVEAMTRAVQALKTCKDHWERERTSFNVALERVYVHAVTTQACRLASNRDTFLSRVREELGLHLTVLTPEQEVRYAVAGCAHLMDRDSHSAILIDIGGGSTEVAWLRQDPYARLPRPKIVTWDSLNIGVVSLAEQWGGRDVTDAVFEGMIAQVINRLQPFAMEARKAPHFEGFHWLGTSGTITTIGSIFLRLTRYDRSRVDGLWMRAIDVDEVMEDLRDTTFRERANNGCIGFARADLVLAGCAIFEAIRRTFPAPRLRIADRGVREGVLLQLMEQNGHGHGGEER